MKKITAEFYQKEDTVDINNGGSMNILTWIIFGALVGWIASMLTKTDGQFGAIANILIGIVGAFIGGMISQSLGGSGVTGFNIMSFIVALVGAMVLLGLYRLVGRRPAN